MIAFRHVCHGTASMLLLLFVLAGMTSAQDRPAPPPFDVKSHYTKYEFRIPMRDGKRLFTSVYVPKDTSSTYPFLMTRTPYTVGPYGEDNYRTRLGPSESFDRAGYIFVFQDVRGRYMSEGTFMEMRPHIDHPHPSQDVDESTDTYDTVEWLLKNIPNNNGKVGIWGISYPGFFTSASIIDSHPAIKAASPEAPMTDLFFTDDGYHGGTFQVAANFGFYSSFKPRDSVPCSVRPCNGTGGEPALPPKPGTIQPFDYGTNDGYAFFLKYLPTSRLKPLINNWLFNDQMDHNTYDGYWVARDLSRHMHGVKCAVLVVGGWFDAEDLSGPFKTFHAIEKQSPDTWNGIVIGPWVHGGWARLQGASLGRVQFDSTTGEFWREHIVFPFFEQHLKGNIDAKLPKAYMFETGSNVWRKYDEWPPKSTEKKTLYLHANGKLSFDRPGEKQPSFDEYVSDPLRPVPFIPYTDLGRTEQEYMVADQRTYARRPDVLVYESDPLEEDVTFAGPVSPHLFVSTSGTDSDYVVKLIDVFPTDYPEPGEPAAEQRPPRRQQLTDVPLPNERMGGYEMLVRGEPMRAKFRNSWEHPEPMTPGKVEALNFDMPDINHTFRRGHRIMIQVQSSWFPLADVNPQTFADIPNAKLSDFKKATERVYHDDAKPSGVVVGVLQK
jgi:uncharacterized protein